MSKTQKQIILILVFLSAIYFTIFYFPNSVGSKNIDMVAVFEPDEAVPLQYAFNMIKPAETLKEAVYNFVFYGYYFYGFPYFAFSSIALLPVKFFGSLNNIPLVMVILRQAVSVLPMLISVWILVYLQTRFRSYKSVVVFFFLLSVPALVQNNFWWHPDSLAILFAVLTIFFLDRDSLRFGKNFFLAAAMCGYSAGIKGIGFYFFLAIFIYLLIGYFSKSVPLKRILLSSLGFLIAMGAGYLVANPTLVYTSMRERYFNVLQHQSQLLTQGYELFYSKDISTTWPLLQDYYGNIFFLVSAPIACILGIIRKNNRLLQIIIVTWAIPLSVLILGGMIHFKYQYWLPVALPLFSTISIALPEKIDFRDSFKRIRQKINPVNIMQGLILLAVTIQCVLFVSSDINRYCKQLNHEATNPSIKFYKLALNALKPLPDDLPLFVYRDIRIYFPDPRGWKSEGIFEMLDYDYIYKKNFDVVLIMQQRILDYTKKSADPIDQEKYKANFSFYSDVKIGQVKGYHLIFRNNYGIVFLRDDLFAQYLPQNQ